jgi:hypothetical protein
MQHNLGMGPHQDVNTLPFRLLLEAWASLDADLDCNKKTGSAAGQKSMGKKKWQTNIAPLQPSTLAAFRPWGSSTGAGRADLPLQRYEDYHSAQIYYAE